MTEPIKLIDNKQKQIIHMAKAQLKMSDEEYRTILSKYFWVNTCKELNYNEASKLIDWLKERGFKIKKPTPARGATPPKRGPLPPTVTQLMSRQQLQVIEHLKKDITWYTPTGYNNWLKKYLKKDHITTSKEAQNVIEALKSMKARQQRTAKAAADTGQQLHHDGQMSGGHYEW